MKKQDIKIVKGYMRFCVEIDENGDTGLAAYTEDYDADCEDECEAFMYLERAKKHIYDLIPGEEFLNTVRCGGFIDYDGCISAIFVDDYETNLGLFEAGIHQGKFLVNGEYFEQLCQEHKVEVNWANK